MAINPVNADIDRLLHDAEHAEAGAEFAKMMAKMQPNNPDHPQYAKELAEKAVRLRSEAQKLADEFGIDMSKWEAKGE